MPLKNIQLIVNPTAGKSETILPELSELIKNSSLNWNRRVTKKAGDGLKFSQEAVKNKADLVVVYGGDGTVASVVEGLIDSKIPLAILPGGSGNVLAKELGIPLSLNEAWKLIIDGKADIRQIDVGLLNKRYFILRASIGFEAEIIKGARRSIKNKIGKLAYLFSALESFNKLKRTCYKITIDGMKYEVSGFDCTIANAASLGFTHFTLDKHIEMTDGLLDVIVVRQVNFSLFTYIIAILFGKERNTRIELVKHWQGKAISIQAQPKQAMQCDGELLGESNLNARIVPHAIRIYVPK